jgi:hypothetical protein
MKNYSIISFWPGFNKNSNIIRDYLCKNYNFKDDTNDIDFIVIGSFVSIDDYNLIKTLNCIKIFYLTEPIEKFYQTTYQLYLENEFNIIFGNINNDIAHNIYKYPLYITSIEHRNDFFIKDTNDYVKNCNNTEKKFCCLINRHDFGNTRTNIYNSLKDIDNIICPSNLFNNCSNEELNSIGNCAYIRQFKFNICPENFITSVKGNITEKIIKACVSGAIPIYCGWFDDIDEQIFNKNRILFYDPFNNDSINEVKNKVMHLLNNEEEFNNFYKQDVFCETAFQVIKELDKNVINMFNNL